MASKIVKIKVDTAEPKILNYSLTKKLNSNYYIINMTILESNLNKVEYSDNSGSKKVLCTSLRNSVCTKQLTFLQGDHSLEIFVSDKAGNMIVKTDSFTVL